MIDATLAALVGVLALVSTLGAGLDARPDAGRLPAGVKAWFLAVNVVCVPLLALGVARLVPLDTAVRTGLVLAAAFPGGSTGPIVSAALGGAPAVASAAFAAASVAGGMLAPFVAWLAGLPLSLLGALGVAAAQLVPWLVGRWVVRRHPEAARRLAAQLRSWGKGLLVAVAVAFVAARGSAIPEVGGAALAAAALILCGAGGLARLGAPSLPAGARGALVAVTVVRNLSLSLLVATAAATPPLTSLTVLVFGLLMYALPLVPAAALKSGRPPRPTGAVW